MPPSPPNKWSQSCVGVACAILALRLFLQIDHPERSDAVQRSELHQLADVELLRGKRDGAEVLAFKLAQ